MILCPSSVLRGVPLFFLLLSVTRVTSSVGSDDSVSDTETGLDPLVRSRQPRQADQSWQDGATTLKNAVFAARGQTAVLRCLGPDPRDLTDPVYTWQTHGQPLADSHFVTKDTGDLEVTDVQPQDSGRYVCTAQHMLPDRNDPQKDKVVHHLLEYTLPKFEEEATFVYRVGTCTTEARLSMERRFLEQLCGVSSFSCVYSFDSTCHTRREQIEPEVFEASQELWVTVFVHTQPYFKPLDCEATCMKEAILANIQKNYLAVQSLENSEIETSTKELQFLPEKLTRTTRHKCSAGYRPYGSLVCLPCEPGTFSKDGAVPTCPQCSINKYQDKFAMTDCFPCPKNGTTKHTGTKDKTLCEGTKDKTLCKEPGVLTLSVNVKMLSSNTEVGLIVGGILGALALLSVTVYGVMLHKATKTRKRQAAHVQDPDMMGLHKSIRQQQSYNLLAPLNPDDVPVYMSIKQAQRGSKASYLQPPAPRGSKASPLSPAGGFKASYLSASRGPRTSQHAKAPVSRSYLSPGRRPSVPGKPAPPCPRCPPVPPLRPSHNYLTLQPTRRPVPSPRPSLAPLREPSPLTQRSESDSDSYESMLSGGPYESVYEQIYPRANQPLLGPSAPHPTPQPSNPRLKHPHAPLPVSEYEIPMYIDRSSHNHASVKSLPSLPPPHPGQGSRQHSDQFGNIRQTSVDSRQHSTEARPHSGPHNHGRKRKQSRAPSLAGVQRQIGNIIHKRRQTIQPDTDDDSELWQKSAESIARRVTTAAGGTSPQRAGNAPVYGNLPR